MGGGCTGDFNFYVFCTRWQDIIIKNYVLSDTVVRIAKSSSHFLLIVVTLKNIIPERIRIRAQGAV